MSVLAVCIITTLYSIIFYHVQLLIQSPLRILLSETSLNYVISKSYNEIDIRYLSFPRAHHYRILPRAEDIVVTSKSGIWNFLNNCYLSVIIHTLLITVCQLFLRSTLNPNEIVSTLHSCRKKISSSEEEAREFNKRIFYKKYLEKNFTMQLNI